MPRISNTLQVLNVGGNVALDLPNDVSHQNLIEYTNRTMHWGLLLLPLAQNENILNYPSLTLLNIPYSIISDEEFREIGMLLKNLTKLDITACFYININGFKQFGLFDKLEELSIVYLFVRKNDILKLKNLKNLSVTREKFFQI